MEFLARNVAEAVEPPHPEHTNMAALAPDDIPTFLAAIEKAHYHTLFYTALFTGMRLGELLGLCWCDVDLDINNICNPDAPQAIQWIVCDKATEEL